MKGMDSSEFGGECSLGLGDQLGAQATGDLGVARTPPHRRAGRPNHVHPEASLERRRELTGGECARPSEEVGVDVAVPNHARGRRHPNQGIVGEFEGERIERYATLQSGIERGGSIQGVAPGAGRGCVAERRVFEDLYVLHGDLCVRQRVSARVEPRSDSSIGHGLGDRPLSPDASQDASLGGGDLGGDGRLTVESRSPRSGGQPSLADQRQQRGIILVFDRTGALEVGPSEGIIPHLGDRQRRSIGFGSRVRTTRPQRAGEAEQSQAMDRTEGCHRHGPSGGQSFAAPGLAAALSTKSVALLRVFWQRASASLASWLGGTTLVKAAPSA